MDKSKLKMVQGRLKKVSERFQARNGRVPTVEELNEAYSEEMRVQQKKSRINYSGNGGLRSMDVERRKEISALGGKKSKRRPVREV